MNSLRKQSPKGECAPYSGSSLSTAAARTGGVDTHRDDGKRFVVRADEILTAFWELESAIEQFSASPFF
jgi:hypothetical protein